MKLTVVLLSLLSIVLARDAKQLSSPLGYGGYPYAGAGLAGAYGNTAAPYYAGYTGNPYAGNLAGGYPYAGQGYAGKGYAGQGYAGQGYAGQGYSGQGYDGYPYGGLLYGGHPYGGYPYAAVAPAKVEAKSVETSALPAVSYAPAPAQTLSYANARTIPYGPANAVSYAAAAPAPVPYSTGSQFHAQDEFGNLNYGYANINSAKQEVGNTYGGVTGEYSYVDANGELQKVQYIADDNGFLVADSRLPKAPTFNPKPLVAPTFNPDLPIAPVDTPEVAAAKEAHFAAVEAVKAAEAAIAEDAPTERKRRAARFSYGVRTYHPTNAYRYAGLPQTGGYAGHQYASALPHGAGYGYAGLGSGMPYYG